MKKNVKTILYVIIAAIIIVGGIICKVKGFNIELLYSNRQEIVITNSTEIEISKVQEIAKSVLENRKVYLQNVERFGNAIQISASQISEDEKNSIVDKVNEECSTNISKDETEIINIANTRIRDILKPYIIPGLISFIIVLVYFVIMYNKIGLKEIILKSTLAPIITELTFYGLISITRIPFGRITNAIAIGLYIFSIAIVTIDFQKKKLTINEKKEND